MSKLKIVAVMMVLLALLVIVPTASAAENQTALELADNDSDVLASECYFDAGVANDMGNGTEYNPYKELKNDRIKDNSIIHLDDGEYSAGDIYHKNLTFIGKSNQNTVIKDSYFLTSSSLTLINLTLKSCSITNDGSFIAKNVIFKDNYHSNGGVIYSNSYNSKINISNSTFKNNHAQYGGAIYINKTSVLNIQDSTFENNYAQHFGGAILAENNVDLTINKSKFINDYSTEDAGGAIYIINSNKFIGEDLEFTGCSATFGGAITSLKSDVTLININAKDNMAKFNGGAFYSMHSYIVLQNSIFNNNSANNGGAIFVDGAEIFDIKLNKFTNNHAENAAGAVYCLLSDIFYDSIFDEELNNSFSSNSAKYYNDAYMSNEINLTIGDGKYILINLNDTYFDGDLPSKYDLRDFNLVTPVRNQGSGGNCWSFSSLAALESCILKATGNSYDLSEGNMKNIMSLFSDYGWSMTPNEGGYDDMGVGYLTAWLGPVNESDDKYYEKSTLSPLLHSLMHVQNVLFLTRSDYTDNDAIKRAIMNYGAVSTCIYWGGKYRNGSSYYNYGNESSNHAVTIVGWDDNYSKTKFNKEAPGNGAWIIKNSWGTGTGEYGYFYVSYYDNKIATVNKNDVSYTFILNDTIKYDKNYQYDIPGRTDYFLNSSSTVWYKNKFTAAANEYLAAVSTYFEKETSWNLSIYVNNVLKHVQSGKSTSSYSTITLNNYIPLEIGDEFVVEFKIAVNGDAGVPISEKVSLNYELYKPNISFISYDGKNWKDLYDLEWKYTSHTYKSQVACIKAFTVLNPLNASIDIKITENGDYIDIQASVYNQYGFLIKNGKLIFNNGSTVNLDNGVAIYSYAVHDSINNISVKFSEVGFNSISTNILYSKNPVGTHIVLNQTDLGYNPIQITATVYDENQNLVSCGEVTFDVEGVNYTVEVNNGFAVLFHYFENGGLNTINAYYNDLYCYNQSFNQKIVNVTLMKTNTTLIADSTYNPLKITAVITDNHGNLVNCGVVTFILEGSQFNVSVVDGVAEIDHIFSRSGYNKVVARYSDLHTYLPSANQTYFNVELKKSKIAFEINDNHNPLLIKAIVSDESGIHVDSGSVTFTIDGNKYEIGVVDGMACLNHTFIKEGSNKIYASYSGSKIYKSSSNNVNVKISKIMLNTSLEINNYFNNFTFTVSASKNINEHIEFYLNDTFYTTRLKEGVATFSINNLSFGKYLIKVKMNSYIYGSTEISKELIVKNYNSRIIAPELNTYYSDTINYSIKLITVDNESMPNEYVSLSLNGEVYENKTDGKGIANFDLKANLGLNELVVIFKGNNNFLPSESNSKIIVNSTIHLPKEAVFTYNSYYSLNLLDSQGNALSNKEAVIVINNIPYNVKTDVNGKISYNLALSPGVYYINVTNPETTDYLTQKITVVKRITQNNDLAMYFGAGKYYKVKVVNDNGKIQKNLKVGFIVNGKPYYRYTDSNGYASFKINLKPGKYTITAIYKGSKVYNKITVKKTIITKNIAVKKGKTIRFTAKLLNSKGKILKYKKVSFKFKGKIYKVKTNKYGKATLKITKRYKVGKYTITTSYGNAKISNKITIKK